MARPKMTPEECLAKGKQYATRYSLGDLQLREDLAQEYAIEAWLAGERADPDRAPRSLQMKRGYGAVIDAMRSRFGRHERSLTYVDTDPLTMANGMPDRADGVAVTPETDGLDVAGNLHVREVLCVAIAVWPVGSAVFAAVALYGYSQAAVAQASGLSPERISQLMAKMRRRLRPWMEGERLQLTMREKQRLRERYPDIDPDNPVAYWTKGRTGKLPDSREGLTALQRERCMAAFWDSLRDIARGEARVAHSDGLTPEEAEERRLQALFSERKQTAPAS
jgi:DNA-directed RNA polymerase specialized sigma24 family protein